MATPIWCSLDGNWGAGGSWSTGVVPVHNVDSALFTGVVQTPVTSGLNQNAINLPLIRTEPAYHGQIGNEANPLTISADRVVHRGKGVLFYNDGAGTTDELIVNPGHHRLSAVLNAGVFTRMCCASGVTILGAGTTGITRFDMFGPKTTVMLVIGGATPSALYNSGARLITSLGLSYYIQDGGSALLQSGTSTYIVQCGGTIRHVRNADVTTLLLLSGKYDAMRVGSGASLGICVVFPAGRLEYASDVLSPTIADMTGYDVE